MLLYVACNIYILWDNYNILGGIIMLSDKIKYTRIEKEMTQLQLANHLNIVRQTVSKWEKGLSVPDADMLVKIAELFDISVSELLGVNIDNSEESKIISNQLLEINKELAIKNRRNSLILKVVIAIIVGYIVFQIVMLILSVAVIKQFTDNFGLQVNQFSEQIIE